MEALDLTVGSSKRIVCPFCQANHETSLSLSRLSEGIVYKCFRAACSETGFIPSPTFSSEADKPVKKKFVPKEFKWGTIKVPEDIEDMLYEKYTITKEEIRVNGFKYSPEIDSLVMPIFNNFGYEVGCQTKVITKDSGRPKAISYFFNEGNRLHYCISKHKGKIILAEDILSAIRINRYGRAVALLGTNLTAAQTRELSQETDTIIMALDPDATHKAIQMKKRYGLSFKNFYVRHLSNDPKDYKTDEQLIEEIFI
jgi:hypothetical protein